MGHLRWRYIDTTPLILWMFWLFFILFSIFYEKKWIGILLAIISICITQYYYQNDKTMGSMWCWIVNSIMIYYAGILLFYLPFCEKITFVDLCFRFSITPILLSLSILLDKVIIIDYIIMSQYIHPENQTIVWGVLNKIPIIKEHMSMEFEQFLIDLFKETICFFYENNKDKKLTFRELESLNKETIVYINEKINSIYNILPAVNTNEAENIYMIDHSNDKKNTLETQNTPSQNVETKNGYIPFKSPQPTESPFEKMIEDEPISNMEELIEQYKKQREYVDDSQIVLPPAII
jgi:hypothetical protein